MLWDARTEVPYPSMSVVTRKKTVQEDRDNVARMMRAHVEGIHFLKTQKEASLKILAKYLKRTADKELLEGSYEIYKEDFRRRPIRSPRDWRRLMNTSRCDARRFTITNPKSSPTLASSPSSTRAVSSRSYTGIEVAKSKGAKALRVVVHFMIFTLRATNILWSPIPDIGSVVFSYAAQAQDKPLRKINWGVTSLSAGNWIPWITKEAKIYDKHGLDVQLVLLRPWVGADFGGAARRQHLRCAGGAADAHARRLKRGRSNQRRAYGLRRMNRSTCCSSRRSNGRIEDMRGKRIANSSLGSLGDFLFKHILRKYGLDPLREVTLARYRHAAGTFAGAILRA